MSEVERLKKLIDELEGQLRATVSTQQIMLGLLLGKLGQDSSGPTHGLRCSFCGKQQNQVQKLIAGPGVYICDECVQLCQEILDEELAPEPLPLDIAKRSSQEDLNAAVNSTTAVNSNIAPERSSADTTDTTLPNLKNENLICSFCGKSQQQVRKLIAGPGVYICDECVDLCQEILDDALMANCPMADHVADSSSPMPQPEYSSSSSPRRSRPRVQPRCSFCGEGKDKVSDLVLGPGVNICKECVDLSHGILRNRTEPNE